MRQRFQRLRAIFNFHVPFDNHEPRKLIRKAGPQGRGGRIDIAIKYSYIKMFLRFHSPTFLTNPETVKHPHSTANLTPHIDSIVIWCLMKTTVEISDSLFKQAKALAAKEGLSFRMLVEEGLRAAAEARTKTESKPFRLRDGSFRNGQGFKLV